MMRRRRRIAGRDQRASAFSASLLRLCDGTGALGAALVDAEGETVDYAGLMDPFDIKVAAAECMVVLWQLRASPVDALQCTDELLIRGVKKSYFVQAMSDGYGIVVELGPYCFSLSRRALHESMRELCAEAGLSLPEVIEHDPEPWWRVEVRCAARDRRRPTALWISGTWSPLEILGRWTSPTIPREIGYRVRLQNGAEVTLVRERLGRWYADSAIAR
jgi:hypothetical protein